MRRLKRELVQLDGQKMVAWECEYENLGITNVLGNKQ